MSKIPPQKTENTDMENKNQPQIHSPEITPANICDMSLSLFLSAVFRTKIAVILSRLFLNFVSFSNMS
jgi:hypothetical protein